MLREKNKNKNNLGVDEKVGCKWCFREKMTFLKLRMNVDIYEWTYLKLKHFFKDLFIYLILERGEGKEKERERNINVWLPLPAP